MAPKKLSDLELKGSSKVVKLTGCKAIKKRLHETVFTQDTDIYIEEFESLGYPMEFF